MHLPMVRLGNLEVTRLIIGGNPFSGFSHQSRERTAEMVAWYTDERVVETLFQAQEGGLNTCLLRGDEHITRILRRYWDQGGTMRWIAQSVSTADTAAASAKYCIDHGAAACFLHGGVADHYVAQGQFDDIHAFVQAVRDGGVPVGIAGHMPCDFEWAEQNVDLDFYMVSYYNPSPRQNVPHHDPAAAEEYRLEDREERVACIQRLSRPAIHYKVMAAGRHDPAEALAYVARHLRPIDAVCVGIYTQDKPNMIAEDASLLLKNLRAVGQ